VHLHRALTAIFDFDNTFARDLDGFYAPQAPEPVREPAMVRFNRPLATLLGLDADALDSPAGAAIFAGNSMPEGATPLAQAYAGHQFGGFNPQLGDGRAVLLGELLGTDGRRYDLALKGSGRTPFSRGGDGRAALGPVLREYLVGEAMHALGVPTTRALAAVTTGETVYRDRPLPGAVLTRVASSHLRVGTFQFFAARGLTHFVEPLLHYAIGRHDPAAADDPNPALAFLRGVAERQASLVARWMHLGFVHGVMNTDNTTISGETIDYGPCAFLESHDPRAVFSSIDTMGRYAYGQQPTIMQWNLTRLAETLLPLVDPDEARSLELASEVLRSFVARFDHEWLAGARRKLGLVDEREDDDALARDWVALLADQHVDHTLAWRRLADVDALRPMFTDPGALDGWLARWRERVDGRGLDDRLRTANPRIIPRNHRVEEAIDAAYAGDLSVFDRLLDAVRDPFGDDPRHHDLAEPAPPGFLDGYQTFCGT
jgi:serine/tyrosine/threonine adenylyltransferase